MIKAVRWQTFAKGSSNQLYWARVKSCDYVLRINADVEDAFGVDRHREQGVLKVIADHSWAVKVLDNNIDAGFCLMQKYQSLSDDYDDAKLAQQMLCFLNALHQVSLSVSPSLQQQLLFDYDDLLDNYHSYFEGTVVDTKVFTLLSAMRQGFKLLPDIGHCLVHQDLHRNNVCINHQDDRAPAIVIIDWEYGAWANPWLDISALEQCFAVSEKKLQQLSVLSELSLQQVAMGCKIAAMINESLACIWYYYRAIRVSLSDEKTSINDNIGLSELSGQIQSLSAQFNAVLTRYKEVLK
ncbi:aminoglycoside phosphotransferase family protein [Gammaproteobacteria bacterium AS21]